MDAISPTVTPPLPLLLDQISSKSATAMTDGTGGGGGKRRKKIQ